jgi:hypothetical protein
VLDKDELQKFALAYAVTPDGNFEGKIHLIKTLEEIKAELDLLQTTGNNFVPNE